MALTYKPGVLEKKTIHKVKTCRHCNFYLRSSMGFRWIAGNPSHFHIVACSRWSSGMFRQLALSSAIPSTSNSMTSMNSVSTGLFYDVMFSKSFLNVSIVSGRISSPHASILMVSGGCCCYQFQGSLPLIALKRLRPHSTMPSSYSPPMMAIGAPQFYPWKTQQTRHAPSPS